MFENLLLIHKICVSVFLLIYLAKAAIMVSRPEKLAKLSKAVKVPEMIVATGFLVTGIWMLIEMGGIPGWMHPKLTAVVVSIPLAIIGIKKNRKALLLMSVALLVYAYGVSETKNPALFGSPKTEAVDTTAPGYDAMAHGKEVYTGYCISCHGQDGKLGMNQASDLSASHLSLEEREKVITDGGKLMQPFGNQLSKEDISAVAQYLESLR